MRTFWLKNQNQTKIFIDFNFFIFNSLRKSWRVEYGAQVLATVNRGIQQEDQVNIQVSWKEKNDWKLK